MAAVRSRSIRILLGVVIVVAAAMIPAVPRIAGAAPHKEAAPPGEVDGQVMDAQGKPMAGVAVTMLKAGEGKPKSTVSGADGSFKFDDLASGVYIGAAAMEGFAPVTCRGIRLVAGQTRRLEVKLMPTGGDASTCNPVEPAAEPGT
jgi:Carboxypeptidase regulatory-like domain